MFHPRRNTNSPLTASVGLSFHRCKRSCDGSWLLRAEAPCCAKSLTSWEDCTTADIKTTKQRLESHGRAPASQQQKPQWDRSIGLTGTLIRCQSKVSHKALLWLSLSDGPKMHNMHNIGQQMCQRWAQNEKCRNVWNLPPWESEEQ